MERVEIPGGHATLRDSVNVGGRQMLERTALPAYAAIRRVRKLRKDAGVEDQEAPTARERASYTEAEVEALQRFELAAVAAVLKHWTLEDPVPRTMAEVADLEPEVYEPIAVKVRPRMLSLLKRPKVNQDDAVDANGKADLDSPTGPSTGSESGERATVSS